MHAWCSTVLRASVVACALTAVGCSYVYTIRLNGEILRGDDHTPVSGATVTIYRGGTEHSSAVTDKDGRWETDLEIYNANLGPPGKNGERPLVRNSTFPYEIRVEYDDQELILPFPKVGFRESNYEAYASVLAILDVTSRGVEANAAPPALP